MTFSLHIINNEGNNLIYISLNAPSSLWQVADRMAKCLQLSALAARESVERDPRNMMKIRKSGDMT